VKKKKMKKIGIVMVALVIVTFMIGTAALMMPALAKATVTTTHVKTPIDITVSVPCALNGTGELVKANGVLHTRFHTTLDANGGFHTQAHYQTQGISGIGLTSGDKYQLIGVIHQSFNGKVGAANTTSTVVNGRVIGPGPGNDRFWYYTSHITVNANGEVTADFVNFEIVCK
jgi:hypothetical protein